MSCRKALEQGQRGKIRELVPYQIQPQQQENGYSDDIREYGQCNTTTRTLQPMSEEYVSAFALSMNWRRTVRVSGHILQLV